MEVGRYIVQGSDVWLNNPRRPLEASGTSGTKGRPLTYPKRFDSRWMVGRRVRQEEIAMASPSAVENVPETLEEQDEQDVVALYKVLEKSCRCSLKANSR
jgi:hypothetical protein